MIDPNHKQATGGKRNHDRRPYPAPEPLIWTERANGFRAEHRGQLVHVRQMMRGWLWSWGPFASGGFESAALAMADAERTFNPEPKVRA